MGPQVAAKINERERASDGFDALSSFLSNKITNLHSNAIYIKKAWNHKSFKALCMFEFK